MHTNMGESPDTSSTSYKAEIIAQHLRKRCEALKVGRASRPLMVSMQGPQGAGQSSALTEDTTVCMSRAWVLTH